MSLPRQLDHRVKNRKLKCTARTGGSGCDAGGPGASEMPSIPTPPNWSPYDRLPESREPGSFTTEEHLSCPRGPLPDLQRPAPGHRGPDAAGATLMLAGFPAAVTVSRLLCAPGCGEIG